MDNGPFRAPRSIETDRRVVNREPAKQRPAPEPQPTPVEEPRQSQFAVPPRYAQKEVKSKKKFIIPGAVLVVIILAAIGWFAWNSQQAAAPNIDGGRYQAVFSTSGLVYFGKLSSVNKDYYTLKHAYYLQSATTGTDAAAATDTTSNDQKLIKLSDAIHGPDDEMTIPKSQVLFYENLRTDSKVAQAIAKDTTN